MDDIMKCAEALVLESGSLADVMELVLRAAEGSLQRDGNPEIKKKAVNSLNYILTRLEAHRDACDKLVSMLYHEDNKSKEMTA